MLGDPDDAFDLLLVYPLKVEGVSGIAFLLFLTTSIGASFFLPLRSRGILYVSLWPAIFHTILGDIGGFWSLYGRIIHGFTPFLILAIGSIYSAVAKAHPHIKPKAQMTLITLCLTCTLYSVYGWQNAFTKMTYPSDALKYLSINSIGSYGNEPIRGQTLGCTQEARYSTAMPLTLGTNKQPITLVNFCEPTRLSILSKNMDTYHPLSRNFPHVLNYPGYKYEHYSLEEIFDLKNRTLLMGIVRSRAVGGEHHNYPTPMAHPPD